MCADISFIVKYGYRLIAVNAAINAEYINRD